MQALNTSPVASLLIIGAEVLSAKVDDQNGPFLLRALRARGVEVMEMRTIGDSVPHIAAATRALSAQSTAVFTTGGIGPTHDDVTIAGIAAAFERPVICHPDLIATLEKRYQGTLNAARQKMAEVPEGASVLFGDGSFVPVVRMHNVYVLPGVPSLMRACFAHAAAELCGPPFFSRALLLDVNESDIAAQLMAVQEAQPEVAIGSYPRFDNAPYRVKVTIDGRSHAAVLTCLAALRKSLAQHPIVGEE